MTPVLGRAAIAYVAETVARALPEADVIVSIEQEDVLDHEPTLDALRASGQLKLMPASRTLLESVLAAAKVAQFPLLITTADNVLLSEDAVHSVNGSGFSKVDAVVVLARREAILAAHPAGKGRYYEFRDGAFSNCNLFWLRDRSALLAAQPFSTGGQFLKTKGRILKAFGLLNAILFATRLLSLRAMFASVSRRLKVKVVPIILADGRLAIDVDDLNSLKMVEDILTQDALEQGKVASA
ncbi:spore coat biosynthesis protein F [Erythrobacter sp. R86502]|uniref:spore coat biosynthesis protein F n=1 Tax=Erythrobacter sp. R86502 TaxID=3093846 RepID=UPI0036D3F763